MVARRQDLVRETEPLNVETPLDGHVPWLTPTDDFYIRCHFPIPRPSEVIQIQGLDSGSRSISADELRRFPTRDLLTTMECAGNGRAFLQPQSPGVQWQLGAVGTASWTGVPLAELIGPEDLGEDALEILFEGKDEGRPEAGEAEIQFERSLSIADALGGDVLLAFAMNGQPLPLDHGGPVRVIVPRWYAMASVKWLRKITILSQPFEGYFQTRDYVVRHGDHVEPCREMAVRAVITSPRPDMVADRQPVAVSGFCWSGYGPITKVELTADGGATWIPCTLDVPRSPYAWQSWSLDWTPPKPGAFTLRARGIDSRGNVQPVEPVWTSTGYGNNACLGVSVVVR